MGKTGALLKKAAEWEKRGHPVIEVDLKVCFYPHPLFLLLCVEEDIFLCIILFLFATIPYPLPPLSYLSLFHLPASSSQGFDRTLYTFANLLHKATIAALK